MKQNWTTVNVKASFCAYICGQNFIFAVLKWWLLQQRETE